MAKTVISMFGNLSAAQCVVGDLVAAGFPRDAIRLVVVASELVTPGFSQEPIRLIPREIEVSGTKASAARTSAIDNGMGSAPFAADLPAALAKLGVPAYEAEYRADAARAGEALVSVTVEDAMVDRAVMLLERHRLEDGGQHAAEWWSSSTYSNPSEADATLPAGEEERDLSKSQVERGGVRVYTQVVKPPVEAQARGGGETAAQIGTPPPVRIILEVVVRQEGGRPETTPKSICFCGR